MIRAPSQRFPRKARLKRRRLIKPLFDRGLSTSQSVSSGCIRLVYRCVPRSATGTDSWIQVGFAPGRHKHSVTRNRLRRRMREAWRTHLHLLSSDTIAGDTTLTVMVLYRVRGFHRNMQHDLVQAMQRLTHHLKEARGEAWIET